MTRAQAARDHFRIQEQKGTESEPGRAGGWCLGSGLGQGEWSGPVQSPRSVWYVLQRPHETPLLRSQTLPARENGKGFWTGKDQDHLVMIPPQKKSKNLLCYPSFDFQMKQRVRLGHRATPVQRQNQSLGCLNAHLPSQHTASTPGPGREVPRGARSPNRFREAPPPQAREGLTAPDPEHKCELTGCHLYLPSPYIFTQAQGNTRDFADA